MVTIPKVVGIIASADVVESRNNRLRSLGLKTGSRKTRNAVKTARSTGISNCQLYRYRNVGDDSDYTYT